MSLFEWCMIALLLSSWYYHITHCGKCDYRNTRCKLCDYAKKHTDITKEVLKDMRKGK